MGGTICKKNKCAEDDKRASLCGHTQRVSLHCLSPINKCIVHNRWILELGRSPAQIALAWLLRQPGVSAIPKAASDAHVRDNRAAADVRLPASVLEQLERAFPAPSGPTSLAIL